MPQENKKKERVKKMIKLISATAFTIFLYSTIPMMACRPHAAADPCL